LGDDVLLSAWGAFNEPHIPKWQISILKVVFPVLKRAIIFSLELGLKEAEEALSRTKKIIAEVEEIFADGRKYLLGTEEPTYIDFAAAALIGAFYVHPKYGGK